MPAMHDMPDFAFALLKDHLKEVHNIEVGGLRHFIVNRGWEQYYTYAHPYYRSKILRRRLRLRAQQEREESNLKVKNGDGGGEETESESRIQSEAGDEGKHRCISGQEMGSMDEVDEMQEMDEMREMEELYIYHNQVEERRGKSSQRVNDGANELQKPFDDLEWQQYLVDNQDGQGEVQNGSPTSDAALVKTHTEEKDDRAESCEAGDEIRSRD